jgi:hypothetical protein
MYISAVLKTAAFSDKNTNSQTRIPSLVPSERQIDNITTSLLHLNIKPLHKYSSTYFQKTRVIDRRHQNLQLHL